MFTFNLKIFIFLQLFNDRYYYTEQDTSKCRHTWYTQYKLYKYHYYIYIYKSKYIPCFLKNLKIISIKI